MPVIVSTSGRLHSEFVFLLFLEAAHRETDRFFEASGVHLGQSTSVFITVESTIIISVFVPRVAQTHFSVFVCTHARQPNSPTKSLSWTHHRKAWMLVSRTPIHMTVFDVLETAVIVHQVPTRCCQNTFRC